MIWVIGYGNPLRGDDSIGQVLAEQLAAHFTPHILQTLPCFQLTPELAEPISKASGVLFIDADIRLMPCTIQYQSLEPAANGALLHHVTPGSLLTIAQQLYGQVPPAGLISIGVDYLDYSAELSPALREYLPTLLDKIKIIIQQVF